MARRAPRILLIGLRGAGKSTVGRALADRRGQKFLDLDGETLRVLGCGTVAEAWSRHGEPAFRDAEVRALRDALLSRASIIALGGGTPVIPEARRMIEEHRRIGGAVVIYLRCAPETLRRRLAQAGADALRDRPSLTGAGTLDEIEQVFAERDAAYRGLADAVIEEPETIEQAVDAVLRLAT